MVDYIYPEKARVLLDVSTENEIREIRIALKQMTAGIEALNQKVESLAHGNNMDNSNMNL